MLAALQARYDRRVAAVRAEHGAALSQTRFAMVGAYEPTSWYLLIQTDVKVGATVDLRMRFNAASNATDDDDDVAQFSAEQFGVLEDADAILILDLGAPLTPRGAVDGLVDQELFRRLPAARGGRVFRYAANQGLCFGEAMAFVDFMDDTLREL